MMDGTEPVIELPTTRKLFNNFRVAIVDGMEDVKELYAKLMEERPEIDMRALEMEPVSVLLSTIKVVSDFM